MPAIEIEVPLETEFEQDSSVPSLVDLIIVYGDVVSARDILVSCVSSNESKTNLDIPQWPKYRVNNLPSKFLRAGTRGAVQKLPSVTLPVGSERSLRIILNSRRRINWKNWAAILSWPAGENALAWYLPFGGSK